MTQYFKHGVLEVTDQLVRARGRSIQLSTIESVDLSRLVFFITLGLLGAVALFGILFVDLLYWYEIILFLLIGAGITYGSFHLGTLTVFTKLTGSAGWPIIGRLTVLREMRSAIEKAMADQARSKVKPRVRYEWPKGSPVASKPDDDDDDDDGQGITIG